MDSYRRVDFDPKQKLTDVSSNMRFLIFSLAALCVSAADPSEGWLSYAVFEAAATDTITALSATLTVPSKVKGFGSDPAFWFGVQTHDGDGALVQPIQAKWLDGNWHMFHEIFDWTTMRDSATAHYTVPPGDSVWAQVTYKQDDNSYDMDMVSSSTGQRVRFNYKLNARQNATESTAYFVLEHQPSKCGQLPPNGIVTWSNISVQVNGAVVSSPKFQARQERPVCGSRAEIVSPSVITLTWNTSEPAPARERRRD